MVTTPKPVVPEIGVSGLKRAGGYVQEEFLQELRGPRGMKMYREMKDNSAIVGAGLAAIEMLIRQVSWWVEPAGATSEDQRYAEHVDTCRNDMSHTWSEFLGESLSMLPFGHAYHELVYKRRGGDVNNPEMRSRYADGLIGWRKIPLRAQETLFKWEFDDAGGVKAMLQQSAPDYRVRSIPIEKALLFRAKSEKNNPEGRSILRNGYRSYFFTKRIEEIEGIGIERDLAGLPVFGIPAACMAADAPANLKAVYENAKHVVTSLRRNEMEGVVYPLEWMAGTANPLYKLELLTTGGRRQFDTTQVIERHERRILMVMLADFILMGHENVGSFALSSDKTAMFSVALGGWLDIITDIFNLHAIPRLMAMNGWPRDRSPRLKHGDIESQSLAALGDYVAKVYGAGFRWFDDQEVDTYLRRAASLPPRRKGSSLVGPDDRPIEPADGAAASGEAT